LDGERLKVVVSGVPRGYQRPQRGGRWLQDKHLCKIEAVSEDIELVEMPQGKVHGIEGKVEGVEVLLAEGGNRIHYGEELDWEDYIKFFTPSLRWVMLCSTGFSDNITPEILRGDVILTNSPGIHTIPIAESVIAAMLDHVKRLRERREDQERHLWRQLSCSELFGSTVLLIGLGNIGRRVAQLCKGFDMRVIGTKKTVEPVDNVDIVFPSWELMDHLPCADFVVVAAPLTPLTENMIGEAEIGAMKETSYLINVGRGLIVDEEAMTRALREDRIGGAYLDCHVVEPLPTDHPLWDMENVFVIPHDSHSSPFIGDRIIEIFCENLRRYIKGESLINVCDPTRGY
jgi:phosphoglycerate dehydrogenase-like enzyme